MFEQDFQVLIDGRPDLGRIGLIPWDMETFGFGVADFEHGDREATVHSALLIARRLKAWTAENDVELVGTTMDAGDFDRLSAFQSIGFGFIDLSLAVRYADIQTLHYPSAEGIAVALPDGSDLDAVRAICRTAFSFGRYHGDSRFPRALADRRYQDWARRAALRGSRQILLVVKPHDSVAAFAIVEIDGDKGYLHLNAVAPEWQGRGMGLSHMAATLDYLKSRGVTRVDSKISAANTAAMSIHARFGARFENSRILLHWHADGARHLISVESPAVE